MYLVYYLYHHWTQKERLNRYAYYVTQNKPEPKDKKFEKQIGFKNNKGYCEIIKYAKIENHLKWKYIKKEVKNVKQ
jgi:hypothetical protein